MKYDSTWLEQIYDSGERIKFLFFWGHQPSANGEITSSCFSQWWPSAFTVDGIEYKTAEHFMMAGKAKLFGDEECLHKILHCEKPAEAKKFGREVTNFNEEIWLEKRYEIVLKGSIEKFSQHAELKKFLLNTNDRVLVEASPVDHIWGIGRMANDPRAENPHQWNGLNLLGFALMETRDLLRS